jgi:ubiquinone/menaquinone biosynthesis C-methylase UbiE
MAFEELKAKQSVMWGAGSYEPIVDITRDVHERLVARLEPRPGERWLDVATGTGAIALRAAQAGALVTGVDLAPALVETARRRADEAELSLRFDVGDAENLPYESASFDVVCSALGVQFAPDHEAVARELGRVCRPEGRVGMVNWTPESGVAEMFKVMAPFQPPPQPGAGNIFDWGREQYVRGLLGADFDLELEVFDAPLHAESGEQLWDLFSQCYGPTKTLAGSLPPDRREELRRAFVDFYEGFRADGGIRQSRPVLLTLGRRR